MKSWQLCSAFEGWRTKAAAAKELQLRLEKAVRVWRQRVLAGAYAGWREHAVLKRMTQQMGAGVPCCTSARPTELTSIQRTLAQK